MATELLIADKRVDGLHTAISLAVRVTERLKRIEDELGELRRSVDSVASAIWDATMYDPAGEKLNAEDVVAS